MYATITPSKTKTPRWFSGKSRGFKNPKIVRGEFQPWLIQGQKVLKDPYVTGETITREPRPSYTVRVGESYRQNGRVKSKQKHISTFSEWDIIDAFLDCRVFETKYAPGRYVDWYDFEKDMGKAFPDADIDQTFDLILEKLGPLESPILEQFKKTEEYHWCMETQDLRDQLKADQDQANAEKRRKEEQSRQYQQHYQQAFTDRIATPGVLSLSREETRIIDICYKVMATQLHPDKGGNAEDMKILNQLKDKIRNGV